MKRAPRSRRIEISLLLVGIALIGFSLGATFDRWRYQKEQNELFSQIVRADARILSRQPEIAPRVAVLEEKKTHSPAEAPPPQTAANEDVQPVAPKIDKEKKTESPQPDVEESSETPLDPDIVGRIEIPRLGVAAIVRAGADESTLARAVGLVDGAARPGESGNIVLAGHRDTFFRPLRKIKVNDLIRLVAPDGTHEYRVDSLRVVDPDETSVLGSHGVEQLTLITCYPFHFIGPAPERFVVSATPVSR